MLKLENIKKSYGPLSVLDIPSWEVKQGESVALLGANATGKTTLLEITAGLIQPTQGVVHFEGKSVTSPRTEIRIVLQNPVMFSTSVAGNIAYGLHGNGITGRERAERIREALRIVGLENLSRKNALVLSEGQKQRVAIARTLALKPRLLLLDEPSASVDKSSMQHIGEILRRLNEKEGLTIIVATHDLDFARRIAKRTDTMRNGRPVPYISGNMYTGAAFDNNGETQVGIGADVSLVIGGIYRGAVDIIIPPEHVVLSKSPIESSMRNRFKGRVVRLAEEDGRVSVAVDIGVPISAALTHSALADLGITIGNDIYVSFKAHGVIVFPHEEGGTK